MPCWRTGSGSLLQWGENQNSFSPAPLLNRAVSAPYTTQGRSLFCLTSASSHLLFISIISLNPNVSAHGLSDPPRHLLANQSKTPLIVFAFEKGFFLKFPYLTSKWANFNRGNVILEQLTSFEVTQEQLPSLPHPSALHPWGVSCPLSASCSHSLAVLSQTSQPLSGSNSVTFGISVIILPSANSFQRKQIQCTKERMKKNTRLLILLI